MVLLAGAGVFTSGSGLLAGYGLGGRRTDHEAASPPSPNTAPVTRTHLVDYKEIDGTLGFGTPATLRYTPRQEETGDQRQPLSEDSQAATDGQKVITWLPAPGAEIRRGQQLFRVDNEPVVLLFGALPMYRTIENGVTGPDVEQFETNLAALGYAVGTTDESFTTTAAAAVRNWQQDVGLPKTGTVQEGQVRYMSGAIRVQELKLQVGDSASGDVYTYTGTSKAVTVKVPEADARLAVVGARVTVTLPAGKPVDGTIAGINPPAEDPENQDGGGDIEVSISITDQKVLASLRESKVTVRFVADERADVLTVPVTALLAGSGGGYGVRVVDGHGDRFVAVRTGLFAGGLVEVSGDLKPGMNVEVAE